MSSRHFYTATGSAYQLGRELGRGGEGSVYEVIGWPAQVAKIYHQLPDRKKQEKLSFMAQAGDAKLLSYAAWPQATLHAENEGPVCGFLMPKVTGRDPIHMLYTPASRRQTYPKAGWDFLLFAARNTAAAFETLHSRGHVLGDVNQGNILVGEESRVVLIDCDSFQINAHGTVHLCEVGVSHFTPPELQNLSSFEGVQRSSNHDNFGLALLLFHLLFGGRHPYSGVPQRANVGETLEDNIKTLRYAYAHDARSRLLLPPPNAIPVSLVPASMAAMFEAAFTEKGRLGERPTAQQWVASLDSLRGHLRKCGREARHVFPDHLPACPWCVLDQRGIVYFVDMDVSISQGGRVFIFAAVWAGIEAVEPPVALPVPDVESLALGLTPEPSNIRSDAATLLNRVLIIIGVLVAVYFLRGIFLLALLPLLGLGVWVGWVTLGGSQQQALAILREERFRLLTLATLDYEKMLARVRTEAGPERFFLKKKELLRQKDEYQDLLRQEKGGFRDLGELSRYQQKQNFLALCLIDAATIPGLLADKRALLRARGIVSAADVNWSDVGLILGWVDPATRALLAWRKVCERRFVFNPGAQMSSADIAAARASLAARKKALEAVLLTGAAELERQKKNAQRRAGDLGVKLQERAQYVAQALADFRGVQG